MKAITHIEQSLAAALAIGEAPGCPPAILGSICGQKLPGLVESFKDLGERLGDDERHLRQTYEILSVMSHPNVHYLDHLRTVEGSTCQGCAIVGGVIGRGW